MAVANVEAQRANAEDFWLFHARPPVMHVPDWQLARPMLWTVLEALPRRRAHLLVSPSWALDGNPWGTHLLPGVDRVRNAFDHVEVTEDFFFPVPGRRGLFDAIYDAGWADYKRHPLATEVESLALITYPSRDACSVAYYRTALEAMAHATWFTKPWEPDPHLLSPAEVNNAYNQSRVGLMLSAREGANFASIQYLLSGLPVVTTHNEGGRDEFLSSSVARWVDDVIKPR